MKKILFILIPATLLVLFYFLFFKCTSFSDGKYFTGEIFVQATQYNKLGLIRMSQHHEDDDTDIPMFLYKYDSTSVFLPHDEVYFEDCFCRGIPLAENVTKIKMETVPHNVFKNMRDFNDLNYHNVLPYGDEDNNIHTRRHIRTLSNVENSFKTFMFISDDQADGLDPLPSVSSQNLQLIYSSPSSYVDNQTYKNVYVIECENMPRVNGKSLFKITPQHIHGCDEVQ